MAESKIVRSLLRVAGSLTVVLLAAATAAAPVAITGARVHTLDEPGSIDDATILIEDGVVQAVGPDVTVPADAERIDASGREVTPGLFVAYSNLGLTEVSAVDESNDYALDGVRRGPSFSVARAVDPTSVLVDVARLGGVTRALSGPYLGDSLFAGQPSLIALDGRLRPVTDADVAMVAGVGIAGGRIAGGSRAAALQVLEEAFADAELYRGSRDLRQRGLDAELSLGRQDLEALAAFRRSDRPLAVAVDRATDILHLLDVVEALELDLVILGGAEAWQVADQLAAADVPVILDPLANLPESYDTLGARLDNATLLHEAGVTVAFWEPTGHDVREIRQYAGNAVAAGLPWEVALSAITRAPAEIWGVGERFGRIAPGMAADLVVWNGDPLEVTTWAERVFVDGVEQPMRSRQLQLRDRYREPDAILRQPEAAGAPR